MPSQTFFHSFSSHTVKPLLSAQAMLSQHSQLIVIPPTNRELGACYNMLSMDQITWFQAPNILTEPIKVLLPVVILHVFCQLEILGSLLLLVEEQSNFFVKICNQRSWINYLFICWHVIVRILFVSLSAFVSMLIRNLSCVTWIKYLQRAFL